MAIYRTGTSSSISNPSGTNSEDTGSIEINVKKKCLEQDPTERSLCPFKLRWSFGMNPAAPMINLTTENRTLLAYACSYVAVIYDYSRKRMLPLQGHQNAVRTLSTTRDGKWLLTADFEEDCVVVVWDTEKSVPACTLFNPHGNEGMTAARISPNAKHIVTVGNEKCQNVRFWRWTYGRDEPDASVSLNDTVSERVKEIAFNDEYPEHFALTTDYHVLFLIWDGHALSYDCPKVMTKVRRTGILNGSCYVPKIQQVFTATRNGCVLVWGNVPPEDERLVDDSIYEKKKRHVKTVNLQKSSITVIAENEGTLVTGSSNGRVTFYDYQLRLLYWCQSCELDSIRWISFDLPSTLLAPASTTDISEEYEYQDDSRKTPTTIQSKLTINIEHVPRSNKPTDEAINGVTSNYLPTDATLQCSPFNVRNFLACSSVGVIALINIREQKCHLVSRHPITTSTSLDAHPESNYVVVGDVQGTVHLYNHEERILTTSRSMPPLPDFRPILEKQTIHENIVYVTCPQTHESLKAVTALKFSPRCDMLACGLENGAIWILHHVTLDLLDETPYKHSVAAINKIVFTRCAKYMAYADNELTVVVFKRNDTDSSKEHMWNLIGKYHSHYLPIRDILFGPAVSDSDVPRFFSLGEDRELVEYDLEHSGPYPVPGLKILHVDRIEQNATPLCLAWYPECGAERFLMISNSEHKYKIFNDITKTIRGTFLGPIFGEPVQHFQVLTDKLLNDSGYMVFATDKEIGLQSLPLDGNPYKIVGMTGHPRKIMAVSVSNDKQIMFTVGYNDPCVLMWKIRLRSVDVMARLGGRGISPFHCLIKGGRKGWLINEMKDLFYYAQILHQGENTAAVRNVSDIVVVEQIPNLMRAIGYYPSNEEIENIMSEVCYKHYAETGKLVGEITFEGFVRLYVNHRPAFGFSIDQTKEAFRTFVEERFASVEDPALTREQFMDILLGGATSETSLEDDKPVGEPLTMQEAHAYLRLLLPSDGEAHRPSSSQRSVSLDFSILPSRISYKDLTMDIMGVELPEEN